MHGAGSGIGTSVSGNEPSPLEAAPALTARDEAAPVGDELLDRGQRPSGEDRGGDDDAEAGVALDDQVGTETEHGRLKRHAEDFRSAGEGAGPLVRLEVGVLILAIDCAPAFGEPPRHAEGTQCFRVSPAGLDHAQSLAGSLRRLLGKRAHRHFRCRGKEEDDHCAGHRRPADQRIDQEADQDLEGQEWQVGEGGRPTARNEAADLVEVAKRLQAVAREGVAKRQRHHRLEDRMDNLVHVVSDPHQDALAHMIEEADARDRGRW